MELWIYDGNGKGGGGGDGGGYVLRRTSLAIERLLNIYTHIHKGSSLYLYTIIQSAFAIHMRL